MFKKPGTVSPSADAAAALDHEPGLLRAIGNGAAAGLAASHLGSADKGTATPVSASTNAPPAVTHMSLQSVVQIKASAAAMAASPSGNSGDGGAIRGTPEKMPEPVTLNVGQSGPAQERSATSSDRLQAIARGEQVETAVHPGVNAATAALEVKDFRLWYGNKQALHNINLTIPQGRITALIGPSGCGKSTLLRSVNRLNDLLDNVSVKGDIQLHGESIYGSGVDVIELRKRMGMVFQKPNPFPMSIFENVVYPLRIDGERRRSVLEDVCEKSLRGAALWEESKDRLHESALRLSGGQQQRLCIARAIAAEPEVLLLDEPCSALDPIATGKIEDLLSDLRGAYTVLIVTHNMQQAGRTSDYTAFMYLGRVLEFGPTRSIFTRPLLKETEDYVTGRFG